MSRLETVAAMLRERRFGFSFDEVMRGYHQLEPGFGPSGQLPMEFRVTWGSDDIRRFLNPFADGFMLGRLRGRVSMDFLCRDVDCLGDFEMSYLRERALRYTFDFEDKGTAYHFVGEKVNIRPWNLPTSHTTCFGTLIETESRRLVSRSVTTFGLGSLPSFVASLRLH